MHVTDDRRALEARLLAYRRVLRTAPRQRLVLERFPGLREVAHWLPLADGLPTPVEPVTVGGRELWVKRDDRTSSLYGGNKVRKLEYLLAVPAARDATVVTGGGDASHHVLATVLYARLAGVRVETVLFAQPANPGTARLAAVLRALDVPVTRTPNTATYPFALMAAFARAGLRSGAPRFLYPGGSTPSGTLGYVDAGLEIAADVAAGRCPPPAAVVTALGSGGTAAGLGLGLALGGVDAPLHAIRVTDALVNNRAVLNGIDAMTRALLTMAGAPRRELREARSRIRIVTDFFGPGYGECTPAGTAAAQAATAAGLPVEQTYTAKALAGALQIAEEVDGPVLFIETVSAVDPLPAAGRQPQETR